MKKPFKIITIFILILFTCFGIGICAFPDNSFAKENSDIGFEDFSTRLCAMIEEYQDEYIMQETSFDLEGDLIKRNNVLMVKGETFKEMTGSYISKEDGKYVIEKENKKVQLSPDSNFVLADESDSCLRTPVEIENGDILFPIEEISNSLGYELKFDNDKVTLNRPYGTKRVIVGSREKIDGYNAIASVEGYKGLHIFQYATEEDTIKACEYFSKLTNIDYYQVDGIVRATETTDNVTITGLGDDFSYKTWGASVMGVPNYSEYLRNTIGTNNLPQLVVAVLDTGIDVNHSWFNGRIAEGGKNFSSSNPDDPDNYQDVQGHGTHVSGTICDLTLNNVKILPVKVLNDKGRGEDAQIIAGIYHVAELKQKGLNICAINMSLSGSDYIESDDYNAYKAAMQTALDKGVLSVVAAGNEGEDAQYSSPANIDIALTVAAVGQTGSYLFRAGWSNYGDLVDVCAPGADILSAKVGGGTVSMSGTSMATPHVAAAVALLMSDSSKNYNINQIESVLKGSVLDLGDSGFDIFYGEGLVNLEDIFLDKLPDVVFSRTESQCEESFDLILSCSEPDVHIYYTTDGTLPTRNSILYTSPIAIDRTMKISVCAYKISANEVTGKSNVATKTYYFGEQDVENAFLIKANGTLVSYLGVLQNVVVPENVNGITVKSIGDSCFVSPSIVSVTLPSTVTEIQLRAFRSCMNLKTVIAPEVTYVGMGAFQNCFDLEYVNNEYFPKLKTIDKYAFLDCKSLHDVELDNVETVGYWAFMMRNNSPANLTYVSLPKVKIIDESAFSGCTNISSIYLPVVENIGKDAFRNSNLLVSINLPQAKVICNSAFYSSENLETLSLPKVQYLGTTSFYETKKLTELNLPEVLVVGSGSFYYSRNLERLSMPKVKYIGGETGWDASFESSYKLTSLDFPELEHIGEYAFDCCYAITTLNAPKLKYIGESAFRYCKALTEINLPQVRIIEHNAFHYNIAVSKVTLSGCLEKIDNEFGEDVKENCEFNYYDSPAINEYLSNVSEETGGFAKKATFVCKNLTSDITLRYSVKNDEICINGYDYYDWYLNGEIVIPSYIEGKPVTKISANAFKNCNKRIKFLNVIYLKEIGNSAFEGCQLLESVYLTNIEKIGEAAFKNCSALKSVQIFNVSEIGDKAFCGCNNLKSIELSENVIEIGSKAFGYDNNESVIADFVLYGFENTVAKTYANNEHVTFAYLYNTLQQFEYSTFINSATGETEICIDSVNGCLMGNIILPETVEGKKVTRIAEDAFEYCCFLTGIIMPNVINIEREAFCGCETLSYVKAPVVTFVGSQSFQNCYSLETVNMPKLEIIDTNVFICDSKLSSFTFENVREIGNLVFSSYINLPKTIYLPKIEKIGNSNFDGVSVKNIYFGRNLTSCSDNAIGKDITVYGYTGTYAKTYADNNGNTFVPLDISFVINLPNNVEVQVTDECILSIEAQGFDLKYQWYYTDDGTYESGIIIENAINSTYIPDTSNKVNRKYFVKVQDWIEDEAVSDICEVIINGVAYNITATAGEHGSISPSGSISVKEGNSMSFSFSPNEWYHISSISVDNIALTVDELQDAIKNGYTFNNVTAEHSIYVEFAKDITHNITATAGEHGSISPSGNITIKEGSSKSFDFRPNEGYHISSISVDNNPLTGDVLQDAITNGYTFNNVTAEHSISVTFAVNTYNITATAGANGSISPSGNITLEYGNSQLFTFISNEGYHVSSIRVDNNLLTGNELQNAITNGYKFNNVTAEHSISVEFTINTYNIVATAGVNGSISPSGNISVKEGNSQTFTFTPNKMYHVSSITVDNNLLTGDELQNAITNGYTFNNVTAEHSISVTFAVNTYTLTIENSEHGEIRVSDETVKHNGSVTITFIPEYHYRLKEAMIDGKVIVLENGTAEYKLNQVTSSHTIKASFVEDLYSVSINGDSNYGNVSYSQQSSEIYGGEARTFTITPIEGYEVDKVFVNGEIVEIKNNTFTVEKISSDIDLEVTYKKSIPPTISAVWGVVIGVVAVVMISSAVFVFVKKRKKKAAL